MMELPNTQSTKSFADWVELTLAYEQDAYSKAEIAGILEANTGTEPSEAYLDDIWREMKYRQSLYKFNPFNVYDRRIKSQLNPVRPEYLFCLLLSLYGVDDKSATVLFERLSAITAAKYLSAKTYQLGWPASGTNVTLADKCRDISLKLHERFITAPAKKYKDRGVDVICWVPFAEGRSGQVVVCIQCAAGHNWKDKPPAPVGAWVQYFHWANNPIPAFSVPCIISDRDWHDNCVEKGIMFDRVRILNLLCKSSFDRKLKQEVSTWAKKELRKRDV